MDNKAALGGIDYASYWRNWGDHPANYFQNTPLLNAIACQNLSFATLYMEYLQKLDEVPRQEILNYKDKFIAGFHTALEFAIRRGYSRLATSIIRAGADTNPQPFVFAYAGKSPLHMACMLCGYSKFTKGWHPDLGSDLELITTLLEHGADYQLRVKTSVYEGVDTHGLMQWKSISLTALDHLGGAFMSVYGLSLRDDFDYIHACNSPAYRPVKVGQIKHPFEEEACFLANFSKMGRSLDNRFKYLSSREYQNTDKWRILDVLSQCMEKNINQCLPISHDKNPLFNPAYRNKIMHCSVNVYQERPDEPFFSVRLQPIGALLDEPAAPDFLVPDDTNDPTPKAGALFSELTMQVLGGFMVVLGVVAVAAAFTVLHTVTLGGIGVVVGGIGLAVLLKGCGLFNVGYDQNHVDQYQQQVFSGAQLVHNAKI